MFTCVLNKNRNKTMTEINISRCKNDNNGKKRFYMTVTIFTFYFFSYLYGHKSFHHILLTYLHSYIAPIHFLKLLKGEKLTNKMNKPSYNGGGVGGGAVFRSFFPYNNKLIVGIYSKLTTNSQSFLPLDDVFCCDQMSSLNYFVMSSEGVVDHI